MKPKPGALVRGSCTMMRGPEASSTSAFRLAGVSRQAQAVFIQAGIRHAIRCADNLLKLRLRAWNVAVVFGPGFRGHKVAVISHQCQPVAAGLHAIRALLQTLRFHGIQSARSNKHLHRLPARLRDNGQARSADLLNVRTELMRRDPLHVRGFFSKDDLRARLAVFNENRLDYARRVRFDLIEQLHRFNNAQRLALGNGLPDFNK